MGSISKKEAVSGSQLLYQEALDQQVLPREIREAITDMEHLSSGSELCNSGQLLAQENGNLRAESK